MEERNGCHMKLLIAGHLPYDGNRIPSIIIPPYLLLVYSIRIMGRKRYIDQFGDSYPVLSSLIIYTAL